MSSPQLKTKTKTEAEAEAEASGRAAGQAIAEHPVTEAARDLLGDTQSTLLQLAKTISAPTQDATTSRLLDMLGRVGRGLQGCIYTTRHPAAPAVADKLYAVADKLYAVISHENVACSGGEFTINGVCTTQEAAEVMMCKVLSQLREEAEESLVPETGFVYIRTFRANKPVSLQNGEVDVADVVKVERFASLVR